MTAYEVRESALKEGPARSNGARRYCGLSARRRDHRSSYRGRHRSVRAHRRSWRLHRRDQSCRPRRRCGRAAPSRRARVPRNRRGCVPRRRCGRVSRPIHVVPRRCGRARGAEGFHSLEGNMCGTAMRGADALPGSKATSRAKGSYRNLGGLASGRRCRVLSAEYDGPHREEQSAIKCI